MKKFGNAASKVNAVLNVFEDGEKLKGKEICSRMNEQGYRIGDGHLKMFIYHNMLYKHLEKEDVRGVNHYYRI
ncbi:MAG: hypothetical protein V3R93_01330 [Candidatus Hydrothermarchaeaceae archaeon]